MHGTKRSHELLQSIALFVIPFLSALNSTAQELLMADAAWDACDGNFYDSGGAGANYGSSQDFVATLCPGGGEGSGAATSVHFITFEMGGLGSDQLVIHDGTSTSDAVLATGNSNNSLAGQTFTATGPSGCLTFHWTSDLLVNAAGWTADVITGPYAGTNASLTICSDQVPFSLFDALGGDPDVGGSWNAPGGLPHSAQFNPAIDPGGTYTYMVVDASLCADSANVTINNVVAPDAGEDALLLICDNSPPVDLINSLGGVPDSGGIWTGPGGTSDGNYDPLLDAAGAYTYTVPGQLACPDASATVTVVLTGPPDAGTDGELLACDTMLALQLFDGLGGTPDVGGAWLDLDGTGALTGGSLNTTDLPAGAYDFRYTVTVAGCGSDEALVTVQVTAGPEVSDFSRDCDEFLGTSVISFIITNGDEETYAVNGVPGTISSSAPFVFTSDVLPDSLDYIVVVSDQNGCGSVSVSTEPCSYPPHVFIPESFSPNGDGINESFRIPGLEDFPGNEMYIFNRWGSQVYHATAYHEGRRAWNGTEQNSTGGTDLPAGTYYYVLDLGNGTEAYRGFIYLNR